MTYSTNSLQCLEKPKDEKSSSIHIVLGIDDTIAKRLHSKDALKEVQYDWFKERNLIIYAIHPHIIHPGAIEFIRFIIEKIPRSKLSFFSNAAEERNHLFVDELIKKAFPNNFEAIRKNISVFSEQHLIRENTQNNQLSNGSYKKCLKTILKENFNSDTTLLIDDDPSYVTTDQVKNCLVTYCNSNFHSISDDKDTLLNRYDEANHLFYLVGVLKKLLDDESSSLTERLFHFQYGNQSDTKITSNDSIDRSRIEKLSYYLSGFEELRKINPGTQMYGNLAQQIKSFRQGFISSFFKTKTTFPEEDEKGKCLDLIYEYDECSYNMNKR